jgi:hypothetical protein
MSQPSRSALLAGTALIAAATLVLALGSTAQTPAPSPPTDAEAPFLAENAVAMDRMMTGMSITPSGDVDADFSAMMIPHHQGAIDMALAELRYGKNEQLRRIAQEIIVDQQQEIAAMRLALGQPLPPSAPAPTQAPPATPAPSPATPAHSHAAHHHPARLAADSLSHADETKQEPPR